MIFRRQVKIFLEIFFFLFIAVIFLSAEEDLPEIYPEQSIRTIRFSEYAAPWETSWTLQPVRHFSVDIGDLIIFAILILCALAFLVALRGIQGIIAETTAIRLDAAALITGDFMPLEKKKRVSRLKRRGLGLHLKVRDF